MLRDGSSHARDQLRRSRSRSRGRVEWPGGARDDGAGRLEPSQYAGPQPVRPMHLRERGEWQSPPDAWPGLADPPRLLRQWEPAEQRGEKSDPMLGFSFRQGSGHSQDYNHRGPLRREEDAHLPEREGRGRPVHAFEERKSRSGPNLDEPHRDAPVSRRDVELRGDVRMTGGKGYDYACGALCSRFVRFSNCRA
jgi:hypothetical protein